MEGASKQIARSLHKDDEQIEVSFTTIAANWLDLGEVIQKKVYSAQL